jgi:hypothetical protein
MRGAAPGDRPNKGRADAVACAAAQEGRRLAAVARGAGAGADAEDAVQRALEIALCRPPADLERV